jgi:hypothetical protein
MTDEWIVLNAIGRAQDVLAAYVVPHPRDEKCAWTGLPVSLDDQDLVKAHERMTWNRKGRTTLKEIALREPSTTLSADTSTTARRRQMVNENDRKPWSDDDLHKLKIMITENTPTGLIAMKLGRTEDAIRDKVAAEGLSLAPTNRSPRD